MVPAVALRHPDDLSPVVDVEAPVLSRVGRVAHRSIREERRDFFCYERASAAGRGVDLDDAIDLMAALVVLECEGMAVLTPHGLRDLVRGREERVVDRPLRPRLDIEQHRLNRVEQVARFSIENRRVLRLQLVHWRREDVVHQSVVAGPPPVRDQFLRVGRPADRHQLVCVALGPVEAEQRETRRTRRGIRCAASATPGAATSAGTRLTRWSRCDVVVLNERFRTPVRRDARAGRLRRTSPAPASASASRATAKASTASGHVGGNARRRR